MSIYAFICTRSKNFSDTTKSLSSYLSTAGIKTKFLVNQKSIFEGYQSAFDKFEIKDDDIVILCHDDIEILTEPSAFKRIIVSSLFDKKTGFIGVAGTTKLTGDAVWWNQDPWREGKHKGFVYHGKDIMEADSTYYGPPGRVVCLDGLFLAAKGKTLRDVGLGKPEHFVGDWDFYDIHYTVTAHRKRYNNKVVPITLLHNSYGELAGRESWHKNRLAFISKTDLPIII
tara:strand:+ start:1283 stop:1966 length:684 start_codon:yes stop_codon:yes gene_type:complete